MPTPRLRTGNAFGHLVLTNLRELIRDPMTFLFVLVFPFLFILLFYLISYMTTSRPFTIGVSQPANAEVAVAKLTAALAAAPNLKVLPMDAAAGQQRLDSGELAALVVLPQRLDSGRIAITTSPDKAAAGIVVRSLLAEATRIPGGPEIDLQGLNGQEPFDPMRFGLPGVLIMAFASLAFFGTATPIIQLRQRGTLKLLGLTPLSRLTFVAAQIPPRFCLAAVQLLIMLTIARFTGFLSTDRLGGVLLSSLLGLLMLFALGYLIGGLMTSVELASGLLAGLMPVMLMFTGILLPLDIMPGWVVQGARLIPLTYLGDALRQHLVGSVPMFSLTTDYLVLLGSAIVLTLITALTFRWDQGEAR